MSEEYFNGPMLDMFLFETTQNIEQLEMCILDTEKTSCYTQNAINEIFRIMHTIKGSSAMMLFNNISMLAHSIEDLFYFLREQKPQNLDCSLISDLVFEGADFIRVELQKIKDGNKADGDASLLIGNNKEYLEQLKLQNPTADAEIPAKNVQRQYYISPSTSNTAAGQKAFKATIFFVEGCEMENIRAFTIINNLKEAVSEISYIPQDIIDNDDSVQVIRKDGFQIFIKTHKSYEEMDNLIKQNVFLKDVELVESDDNEELEQFKTREVKVIESGPVKMPSLPSKADNSLAEREVPASSAHQSVINVSVTKLDKLMDLVGEMVIAESMVTQNPDLVGLQLDNFQKASRQLHKITSELQDMVMSIRMVPLSVTFQKMHRIVRDMNKRLGKDVELVLIGEETEVDKNIIEHISDPLMHLVRNSIDHGIEDAREREAKGKSKTGRVTLEAKNSGSDVLIVVKDDGKGLSKEKIIKRASENGLLTRPANEMSDKEIFNIIFMPGFSTNEKVTEFSGRGVGMDVVMKNIIEVGGSVSIDSMMDVGSAFTLKIPLTLAIIDGMNIQVGNSRYTIPTTAIRESFRPRESDIIKDPDGYEMIMVRGQCYPIIRLHQLYKVDTDITDFTEGILVIAEHEEKTVCIFADELIGQQQVVVKTLPNYIKNISRIHGISGCTLLGDGSISLILDVNGLINTD